MAETPTRSGKTQFGRQVSLDSGLYGLAGLEPGELLLSELTEIARAVDLPGRSSMTKDQLAAGLADLAEQAVTDRQLVRQQWARRGYG